MTTKRTKRQRRDRDRGPFAVWGIRVSENLPEPPTFPTFRAAMRAARSDMDGATDVDIDITDRVGVIVWSDRPKD